MGLIPRSRSGGCSGKSEENLGVSGLRKGTSESRPIGYSFIHSINVYGMPAILCARSFYPTALSYFPALVFFQTSFHCVAMAGLELTALFRLASDLDDLSVSASRAAGIVTVHHHF